VKRLRPFEYCEPRSIAEAVAALAGVAGEGRLLAGGTDLVVDMKLGRVRPSVVVNLKRVPGLGRIEEVPGGTRIGALVRVDALAGSAMVEEKCRALAEAARVLASPPVRRLATLGGNLGRASPASDLAPPLIVAGASVTVAGPSGDRVVPIEGLDAAPGVTVLSPDEVITDVFIPDPPARGGSAHRKLGKRGGGWDLALVGVSVGLALGEDGEVTEARIALASVGPTPVRARVAEYRLQGRLPTAAVMAEAADAAAEEIRPITDVRASASYRRALARVLTMRTLQAAVATAKAGGEFA